MTSMTEPSDLNLPSNSKNSYRKDEPKKPKAEKVISGTAKVQKKPVTKQVAEAMVGDVQEVKSYLLWDVLIPALKDTIVDLIKNGAEALFHAEGSKGSKYVKRDGRSSYVSYSDYSRDRKRAPRYSERERRGRYNPRAAYDFDSIIFDSRADAENVLDLLVESTMQYGLATVADLYELSGIASSYTDTDYGWRELSDARVERTRNGYIISVPRPEYLNDD